MKQSWMQTLGGLAILILVPVLTILCLSPDIHDWLRTVVAAGPRGQNSSPQREVDGTSELTKRYLLPNAISKIAVVSEEEPDLSKSSPVSSSGFSRAILRLQHALKAHPNWNTKDVFRAVNGGEDSAKAAPCPFEWTNGEQSIVLAEGKYGASLTETLNRCAAAVEQMTGRER